MAKKGRSFWLYPARVGDGEFSVIYGLEAYNSSLTSPDIHSATSSPKAPMN